MSVGDYVKEGADLVNLESIDPLKVDFRVPETYLRQVQTGQPLHHHARCLPGQTYDGKVIAVNPLLDAAGRSMVIRAQVRNQDTALRPGMFARVRLVTKDVQDAMVVPEQALGAARRRSSTCSACSTARRCARRSRPASAATPRSRSLEGLGAGRHSSSTAGQIKLRDGAPVTPSPSGRRPAAIAPPGRPQPTRAARCHRPGQRAEGDGCRHAAPKS